ncbi:hypothetical protein KIN20_027297 [Parelaphostrongylus tenuis]|uniref:Uncharacterized protein n=1 Tax=Parelaphostrongylus tenuis TaxID=148309 RepID=A0AAD5WDP2_PARTN|nr:hypothetical protein KIN20_027297 [Parelaphostrongylus tenuis]
MELSQEQKAMLIDEYRLSSSPAETSRRLDEAEGDGTIKETAVFDRFNEFKA